MVKIFQFYFVSLFLFLSCGVVAEEELPSLPEPEFNFAESSKKNDGSGDPLAEIDEVFSVEPAKKEEKNAERIELIPLAPKAETGSSPILIDPLPARSTGRITGQTTVQKGTVSQSTIQAVRFISKEAQHFLEIEASSPIVFSLTTQKKAKQFIYTFKGVTVPKKLRRAYNTTEFDSPVAMYTLSQVTKKKKVSSKLIIKMRELVLPEVIQEGNFLRLQFPSKSDKSKKTAERKLAAQLPENSLGESAFGGGKSYQGDPIKKLELKNADIREAIRLVLNSTGYNVVMSEEVKGQVGSLTLSDTPWDQAFHLLLKMKGLGYVLQGNIIQIAPVETLLKEREQADKREETEPLKTVLIPISYAKAGTLAPRAQPFLSKRGKVDIDERTNTILIRDVETVINRIQKVFAVLDTQPPSVSISAKFVEVTKGFSTILGLGNLSLAGQTSGISFGVPQANNGLPGFVASTQSPFGTINLSAPKFAALNASLSLGEVENSVKILANPTITVQQGQKGNITQGSAVSLPQAVIPGGVGLGQAGLQQTANLTLDVTPIVANDGSISLDTNLLQELPRDVGGGGLGKDSREIKTQIILKNGDTAVLGGVFTGRELTENKGVPFLRNLPLLSYFFSGSTKEENRSEVLIFITARILNPESAFKQNL